MFSKWYEAAFPEAGQSGLCQLCQLCQCPDEPLVLGRIELKGKYHDGVLHLDARNFPTQKAGDVDDS